MATLGDSKRKGFADANESKSMGEHREEPDPRYRRVMDSVHDDIIDVSSMDFDDVYACLQKPKRRSSDEDIRDLHSWLRSEPGSKDTDSRESKRSIDTRTFTRPKKRSGRLSFESILETPVSPSSDVWKTQSSQNVASKSEKAETEPATSRRESTPPMLRPSNPAVVGLSSLEASTTSGQKSLEAFLNMSQSKGIDSFINLGEPEFNETLMNVSMPSVLQTSLMSTTRADFADTTIQSPPFVQTTDQSCMEDSQILTQSMMQTSVFGDIVEVESNGTFASNFANLTIIERANYVSSLNDTFVEIAESTRTASSREDSYGAPSCETDTTFTSNLLPVDPHASYTVARDATLRCALNDASFVVGVATPSIVEDASATLRISNGVATSGELDATFTNSPIATPTRFLVNSTFETRETNFTVASETRAVPEDSSITPRKSSTLRVIETSREASPIPFDEDRTFVTRNFDATYERPKSASPRKSAIVASPRSFDREDMNATYQAPTSIDSTYVHSEAENEASPRKSSINPTVKPPTAPSIKKSPSTIDRAVDSTLTMTDASRERRANDRRNDVPTTNRYNTYKKSSATERTRKENYPTNNQTSRLEVVETINRGASLENLDSTYCKQAPKIAQPSRLNAPRPLSRLPQTLQKSNPNLISGSLRAINNVARTAIPSYGFNKLARPGAPRHADNTLASKLYALAKVKSGSEQRLETGRNAGDYQIGGTGGSTESIESTQSAHSAPDFDDRLSVCSDSSNASYSARSINIDELQKISRMRDEPVKQQPSPEPKRRLLENTWIDASKNLPSPILKRSSDTYGSRGSSPRSMDSTVKTSSPLLSPAESLQNLTINVTQTKSSNTRENKLVVPQDLGLKKLSEQKTLRSMKSPDKNRGVLKPPTNRAPVTANRPTSGIPRPASRIPAPRLVRPAAKINQGDIERK